MALRYRARRAKGLILQSHGKPNQSYFVHEHPQFGLPRDPESSKSLQEPQGNWRRHCGPTDNAANVGEKAANVVGNVRMTVGCSVVGTKKETFVCDFCTRFPQLSERLFRKSANSGAPSRMAASAVEVEMTSCRLFLDSTYCSTSIADLLQQSYL
ncbi:hypothetical protein EN981_27570 [Mesorhizobium sp. M7A.F.Ca.CA.001.13.2.1]|nr:hypothetical protein EN981_27570 [Mesorhizobium sp. M7A.F.Ca.CA.001.13.2.1]